MTSLEIVKGLAITSAINLAVLAIFLPILAWLARSRFFGDGPLEKKNPRLVSIALAMTAIVFLVNSVSTKLYYFESTPFGQLVSNPETLSLFMLLLFTPAIVYILALQTIARLLIRLLRRNLRQ